MSLLDLQKIIPMGSVAGCTHFPSHSPLFTNLLPLIHGIWIWYFPTFQLMTIELCLIYYPLKQTEMLLKRNWGLWLKVFPSGKFDSWSKWILHTSFRGSYRKLIPPLPHQPQNRPLQFIAETAPPFDNLRQHLTVCPRNLSQYLSQRLWWEVWILHRYRAWHMAFRVWFPPPPPKFQRPF